MYETEIILNWNEKQPLCRHYFIRNTTNVWNDMSFEESIVRIEIQQTGI
jgi:hypothetical protein